MMNDISADSEIITTATNRVACDGGGGALGHPRVWLVTGDDDRIQCPYCSRLFILESAMPARHRNHGGDA